MMTTPTTIGQWVIVRAIARKTYEFHAANQDHIVYQRTPITPTRGQLVGATHRYEGVVTLLPDSYHPEGRYSPYLANRKAIFLLLVRFGFQNKPVIVFPQDLEPTEAPPTPLPKFVQQPELLEPER